MHAGNLNDFASLERGEKNVFLSSMTNLVSILEKLPFHMALQSYLLFKYHYINKFKSLNCI